MGSVVFCFGPQKHKHHSSLMEVMVTLGCGRFLPRSAPKTPRIRGFSAVFATNQGLVAGRPRTVPEPVFVGKAHLCSQGVVGHQFQAAPGRSTGATTSRSGAGQLPKRGKCSITYSCLRRHGYEMLLSVTELAKRLDVNESWVRFLVQACRIRGQKVGGRWLVDEAHAAQFRPG